MIAGVLLMVTGVAVLFGYGYDIDWLTSVNPGWVSMKPFTAAAFVCTGLMCFSIRRALSHIGLKWEVMCSTAASSLMMLLFWETVRFAIDGNPIAAQYDPAYIETVLPGMPSIGTIVCFGFVAACGFVGVWNTKKAAIRIRRLTVVVAAISLTALLFGYGMDISILRFYNERYSTGMAFHTALCFLIAAISIYLSANSRADASTFRQPMLAIRRDNEGA